MSFDDEDYDDLDAGFLSRWDSRRTTVAEDEDELVAEEEDEESDLWSEAIKDRKSLDDEHSQIARILHEAARKKDIARAEALSQEQIAAHRAQRRDYQRRYRSGEIAPARAVAFKRQTAADTGARKRLTYKLTEALRLLMQHRSQEAGQGRRQVLIEACCQYLDHATEVAAPANVAEPRKFMYDEIPADLWDQIDTYCRNDGGKRTLRHFQFVELALAHYLTVNS